MIIAVACDASAVTGHFGHCQSFAFFTAENGVITKEESVPNPGHKPGLLPNLVADFGAKVIIAGGMGVHAASIFRAVSYTHLRNLKCEICNDQLRSGALDGEERLINRRLGKDPVVNGGAKHRVFAAHIVGGKSRCV